VVLSVHGHDFTNNNLSTMQNMEFKCIIWNADGIRDKLSEIPFFLTQHNPDIFVITESHLSRSFKLRFPNYIIFRNDGPNSSGGIVMCVKCTLNPQKIKINAPDTVESTSIVLPSLNLSFVGDYNHPNNILRPNFLNSCFRHPYTSFLMGELNARHPLWGNITHNRAGRELTHYITVMSFTLIVLPTFLAMAPHPLSSIYFCATVHPPHVKCLL